MTQANVPLADPDGAGPSWVRTLLAAAAWVGLLGFCLATAGAVDPSAAAGLAAFFLVLALFSPVAALREVPLCFRIAVGAALLACAAQLIPLPQPVRAFLAPGPASARSDLQSLGLQGGWAPITADVGGTILEALLWGAAAALLAVVSRPSGPPLGAKVVLGLLVVLHGIAWIDWVTHTRVFPLTYIEDPWGEGQDRVRFLDFAGWLINRNHWAALGLGLWPMALFWGARGGPIRRGAGLVLAAGVVVSIVTTKSRAGLGLVGLQVSALVVYAVLRLPARLRLGVAALAILGAFLGRGQLEAYAARISASDVVGRADVYVATLRLAQQSPLLGWGMGSFEATFPSVQPDGALYTYSHAHCDPIEWIAGAGVLGAILVGALVVGMWRSARDRRATPLSRVMWALSVLGMAAAACVEFPLQIPALRVIWIGILFAGPPRASTAIRSLPGKEGESRGSVGLNARLE